MDGRHGGREERRAKEVYQFKLPILQVKRLDPLLLLDDSPQPERVGKGSSAEP